MNPTFSIWATWTAVTLACTYILPLFYVRARLSIVTHVSGTQENQRSFVRDHPNDMMILACLMGIPGPLILYLLDYPLVLIVPIVAIGLSTLVIAVVSLKYRASAHLAVLTSVAVSAYIILNLLPIVITPFILILAWSRWYLGKHTPGQLITGLIIGFAITLGMLTVVFPDRYYLLIGISLGH
ncbi:hypothetical protein ACFLTP_05510 [Chloroflexota bacterium]